VFYTNTITPDIGVDILEVKHIVMMMLKTTNRRKKFHRKNKNKKELRFIYQEGRNQAGRPKVYVLTYSRHRVYVHSTYTPVRGHIINRSINRSITLLTLRFDAVTNGFKMIDQSIDRSIVVVVVESIERDARSACVDASNYL